MTPDGEWIVAVETAFVGCFPPDTQRIAMVRPDGTDHRVLVDYPVLQALKPSTLDAIDLLRVSGDGARAYFVMPTIHSVGGGLGCGYGPPAGFHLLDTESGALTDFAPDGLIAGDASWSDDGRVMAFKAINPQTQSPWFYIGGPDGSGAVPFLHANQWLLSKGILSGDGRHFLVVARSNVVAPILSDVYVYDIRRGTLVKVTPTPVPDIWAANLSADGSRVVYDDGNGTTYAVNGDGTDHRVLVPALSMRPTISRDGEHVFLWKHPEGVRMSWNGAESVPVAGGYLLTMGGGFLNIAPAAISGNGDKCAFWADDYFLSLGPYDPLCTWSRQTPVLGTYGQGLPGTVLTWEVGGTPGGSYLLAWSPVAASIRLPSLGMLGLSPTHLRILGGGTITSVTNTGKLEVTLPSDLGVVAGATLHFQALHVDAATGEKALTNTTAFTFPAASTALPAELSRGDRLWIEHALEQGHSSPRCPQDPWLLHALHDPTLDVSLLKPQVPADH
jgi:hypothetical protein